MKKIIAVLLAVVSVLCLFSACSPKKKTFEDYTYIVQKDDTVKIVKYNGTEEVITLDIPASIEEKKVTVIGEKAFADCAALVVVNFPADLVTVEKEAFKGSSIKKAFLNKCRKLNEIGESAFADCAKLVQVDISDSVAKIGEKAFSGDAALKVATFRGDVAEIAASAFEGCDKVTVLCKESAANVKKYIEANKLDSKVK